MKKLRSKYTVLSGVVFLLVSGVIVLPNFLTFSYSSPEAGGTASSTETRKVVRHIPTPDSVKAIYMTACVASTPSWREALKRLIMETELNAVVIDIKDSTGSIAFVDEELQDSTTIKSGCKVRDLGEYIESLHDEGIYVIGRISVFQDPYYTAMHPELAVKSRSTGGVWKDRKGLSFIDVGAQPYWDYIVDISKRSYALGFDELNFDYIRYPSDGNMQDTNFTWALKADSISTSSPQVTLSKSETLEKFFSYLHNALLGMGAKTSADLFGMTTTVESDMNIGQVLEGALPYFDYIAPMVYPSHYPKTWNGFANPASQPYEVVKIAMTRAVERERAWQATNGIVYPEQGRGATSTPSKMRPWLQDFDLGATYDAPQVRAQIQATYDSGLSSWMLWSASNKYTENALLPE